MTHEGKSKTMETNEQGQMKDELTLDRKTFKTQSN